MHDTFTSVYRPASRPWYGPGPAFCPPWRPDAPFHIPPEPQHHDRQFGMGPPNSCHSRRSKSPLAERRLCNEREGHFFAPKQQLQQPRPVRDQMKEDQLAGQALEAAITVKQQELSEAVVPKDLRLPQPPIRRTVPDWVEDCFAKDEYALLTEEQCNIPFLREGVVPKVGMMLYLQMTYKHDGSHPQHYRTWGRMVGEITHVYDPPEVGVYAVYDGQEVRLSPQELQEQRNNLPALPPSLFGQNATCECCRTAEQVVEQYGAVHGQRVKGKMWLMKRDSGLEPQLGGFWDIELVANDNLESMWVLCAMSRQDNEQPQEQLPRQRQHQEQQQAKQAQKQAQQHEQQQQIKQAQQQAQHPEQQQQTKQVRQQAQQQAQQLAQPSPQSRDTRGDESGQDQQQRPQSVQPASPRAQMEQQKESQVQGYEPLAGRSQQQQQQPPALFYRRQQPQKHQQGEPCPHGARQAEPMAQHQQPLLRAGSDRQYDRAQQQEQHVAIQLHDRAHSATCQQQPHNRRKQQDWGREQGHYNQQQQQQHDRDRERNREQRQFDQRRESYGREQQRERHDREQRQEHINPQQQRQAHERQRQQQPYDRQQRDHVSQPHRDREQQRGYKRERNGTCVHDHGYQDSDRSWQGREHNRDWNHKQERDWDYRDRKRSVSSGSG